MTAHDHDETPTPAFRPDHQYEPGCAADIAAKRFLDVMQQRRSVRFFSDKPVAREVIETIIAAAGTAPSGANKQPWRFVAVQDPEIKREIRLGAEQEEREFYQRRDWPEVPTDHGHRSRDSGLDRSSVLRGD